MNADVSAGRLPRQAAWPRASVPRVIAAGQLPERRARRYEAISSISSTTLKMRRASARQSRVTTSK